MGVGGGVVVVVGGEDVMDEALGEGGRVRGGKWQSFSACDGGAIGRRWQSAAMQTEEGARISGCPHKKNPSGDTMAGLVRAWSKKSLRFLIGQTVRYIPI